MPGSNIDVYIRLLNARRFQSALTTSARGVNMFTAEVEAAAGATTMWGRAQGAAVGSLYALGAASRTAGFLLAGIGTGVTIMGLKFNATMQSNALAFAQFVGGTKEATKFTKELFDLAAEGPFEFDSITTAARRLLAFGFNAKETTKELRILSDTLAYTGGDTDKILRITKAFGDIKSKGRLMQQELNQLTNAGIGGKGVGFNQALRKELGLSRKQMLNIGKAGIDGEKAINAINKILKETYGGGAKKYAKTWEGQINRIKDYSKRAAGALTKPLFDLLTGKTLPAIGDKMKNASKFFESKRWKKISADIYKWVSNAFNLVVVNVKKFFTALKPIQPFLENVILPILKGIAISIIGGFVVGLKLLYVAVKVLAPVLGWLGKKAEPLKGVFQFIGVVIGLLLGPIILKAIGWLGKLGGVFRLVGVAANLVSLPFRIFFGLTSKIAGGVMKLAGAIGAKFTSVFPRIGGFFGGIINLGSKMVGKLENAFNKVFNFLGKLSGKFTTAGIRIGDALFTGIRRKLVQAFTGIVGIAATLGRGIADWLNAHTPFGDTINLGFTKFKIPALAQGGFISTGGLALVGERGPELVSLPSGSSVVPAARAARVGARTDGAGGGLAGAQFGGFRVALTAPIYIGKRQIGEAFGEYVADREARR